MINLRLNNTITKPKKTPIASFRLTFSLLISFCLVCICCFSNSIEKSNFDFYLAEGEFYVSNLQFDEAELNYQKAINYCDSLKNKICSIKASNHLIKLWIDIANYQEADSLLSQNLNLIKKHQFNNIGVKQNTYYLQSLLQLKQGNYKKALEIKEFIKVKNRQFTDSVQLALIYELKGLINIELDANQKAFEWFNEAYAMHPKKNMKAAVANYHFNTGLYFFSQKEFLTAEKKLIKCLELRKDLLNPKHSLIADCYFWLGKIQLKKERFEQADSLLQLCLSSRKAVFQNEMHPSLSESYEGLAQLQQQQANYTEALQYYQLSIKVLKNTFQKAHPHLGKLYNNLASVQQTTHDYQNAYKSYTKALSLFKKFYGNTHQYYLKTLNNFGILNMNAQKMDAALANFKQAIAIAENASVEPSLLDRLYYDTAVLFFYLDNYNRMNDYLNKVKNFSFYQRIELAKMLYNNKNYSAALNYLILANTEKGQQNLTDQADLHYRIAQSNYALYNKNGDYLNLDEAQQAIRKCDTLIQQRRKEVGELLRFNEMIRPAYNLGLQIFDTGFQNTNDSIYIDLAFQFIHTNKAHVLLNRLNENKAIQLGLNQSLIKKENNYRREINRLRKEENQVKNKDSVRQKLRTIQNEYKTFKRQLEKEHPQYYTLKYNTKTVNITQIQTHIDNQTSVIEYFLSEDILYILQIEKNKKRFFKAPNPADLFQQIDAFRQTIKWGIIDSIPPSRIYKTFVEQATTLYNYILQQPLKAIASKNIQQLLIIPDNQLNYLPFDLLLSDSLQTDNKNFTALSYVLKKYAVGYAYSSSFLTDAFQKKQPKHALNYIGYAPSYESTAAQMVESVSQQKNNTFSLRGDYSNLLYTSKAVLKIDSLLNGESYINEAASKQQFLKNVNRAKIQHLAMHGEVDDENPQNSKLIFGEEDLTMGDLNTLQINADLMVLTACNTGTGQLKNGEGVMSLSRAFAYAGCPSVIMSLWSLPDKQTAHLSELFFTFLKEGMPKHKALQQAKLSYLQKPANNFSAHPFFWGGLVATGNMEPVFKAETTNTPIYWYALLLLLIPLLLYIIILIKYKYKYKSN